MGHGGMRHGALLTIYHTAADLNAPNYMLGIVPNGTAACCPPPPTPSYCVLEAELPFLCPPPACAQGAEEVAPVLSRELAGVSGRCLAEVLSMQWSAVQRKMITGALPAPKVGCCWRCTCGDAHVAMPLGNCSL